MTIGRKRGRHRSAGQALCLVATALLLGGCSPVEQAEAEGYQPVTLAEVDGSSVTEVTFTQEGADRVGLQTALVGRRDARVVVDYAALIYDGAGIPWVYTSVRPLSFLRAQVEVDRVEDGEVLLTRGPDPGARVVTVGASEVYGAELDIAGGH